MNQTETIPRVRVEKSKQKPARTFTNVALLALGIFIVGGLVGAFLVNRNQTPPMQGNEACKAAMVAQTKQLQASLNNQFGTPTPAGTPSADDVKSLQQKCDDTYEMYTVKVEAAK